MEKIRTITLLAVLIFYAIGCKWGQSTHPAVQNTRFETNEKGTNPEDTLDFGDKINELKNSLGSDFIIESHLCFVVASNLSKTETRKIIENTITAAYESFYNDYFKQKPTDITTIFLFKDDKTYRYWAKTLYDDTDLSRFGYYKPSKKVMLMNISTGTGTLVHEMTHALVRYDFPDIPSWFNEGLGSLYERCSINNGVILGYVNWRLPSLQDAIGNSSYTSLDRLLSTDEEEFYGSRSDFNYAQARYLCLYLQEKGQLRNFYKSFRDGYTEDKTGKKFLEQTLSMNLKDIDKQFVEWAKTLKYER
jgi:hypothetical protein